MTVSAVVLDASATAAWLLPEESSVAAKRVYARLRRGTLDAQAPERWLWECGNIIANGVRQGRLDKPDALLTWSVLDAIRSRVELTAPVPAQARAALVLALDHGISLDAAAYLWLALSLKLPLLSHDDALARAAAACGIAVVRIEALA